MSPILPTYQSKQNVNANISEPMREEATQPFKDQQKVLGALQDITQKWSDAHDVMQYTEAKAKYGVATADIENRAAVDPDFKNSGKYFKELEDAKKNSITGISNKQVGDKLNAEFDYGNEISKIKIDANFKGKQLEYNKVMLSTNIDELQRRRILSSTPSEKMDYEERISSLINYNKIAGTISDAEAHKLLLASKESGALAGISVNPDAAIQELKDNKGYYSDMPLEDRASLIEKAKDLKHRQAKEDTQLIKDIQMNTEAQIVMDMANGKSVPLSSLSEMLKKNIITADFAESAIKAITSPDSIGAITNSEEFSKLTEDIFKSDKKEEVRKTVKNILKGGGDGKLSKDDMAILISSAQNKNIEKRDAASLAVKTLGDWADKVKADRADVFRDFQKKISSGKEPQLAVQETMNENTVKIKPELIKLPVTGKVMIDKNGNKAMVFPDGHYEEMK
jgi:hypothetical protein